jgi:hypothetical protein
MAARLSALRDSSALLPAAFLVLISLRGLNDPTVIMSLEGSGKLKKAYYLIGN